MTSLQDQLKQISSGVSQQFHVDVRKKKSLLYDEQEAAKIDLAVFYENAKNALEHLINLENSLRKFQKKLFSESSIHYEPSIQEPDVKTKTDHSIQDFMIRVSPFLQIPKIPLEVIEWLIQRYQVHLHQPDEIIRCVLPFHDTSLFPKFIQLIDLNSHANRRWAWLRPISDNGIPLSKDELIRVCSRDMNVLLFICRTLEMNVKAFKRHARYCRPIIAMFTQVSLGLLERQGVSDNSLSSIINYLRPSIESGLVCSRFPEYQAACIIIVHSIIRHTKLSEDIAAQWVGMLLSHPSERHPENALMLAHLIVKQHGLEMDSSAINCVKEVVDAVPKEKREKSTIRRAIVQLTGEMEEFPDVLQLSDDNGEVECMDVDANVTAEGMVDDEKRRDKSKEKAALKEQQKKVLADQLVDWVIEVAMAGSEDRTSDVPEVYALSVLESKLYSQEWFNENKDKIMKAVVHAFILLQHDSLKVRAAAFDCLSAVRRMSRRDTSVSDLANSRALRKLCKRSGVVDDRTFIQQAPFNILILEEVLHTLGADVLAPLPSDATPEGKRRWERSLTMVWRFLTPSLLAEGAKHRSDVGDRLVQLLSANPKSDAGKVVWQLCRPELVNALTGELRSRCLDEWLKAATADEDGPCGRGFYELNVPVPEWRRMLVALLPTKPGISAREMILRKHGRPSQVETSEELREKECRLLLLLNAMRQKKWEGGGEVWLLVQPLMQSLSIVMKTAVSEHKEQVKDSAKERAPTSADESSDDESIIEYETDSLSSKTEALVSSHLGCLLTLFQSLSPSCATSDVILEPLLDCLSLTQPLIRRTALLIVSEAARLRPGLLLRNMMPLLTFMRRHVFPLDDASTLEMIERVLGSVVPAYVQAKGQEREKASVKVVEQMVDSFQHVPRHRRLPMFAQLGRCLMDEEEAGRGLWTMMWMLGERMSREWEAAKGRRGRTEKARSKLARGDADFLSKLLTEFSILQQIQASTSLLAFSKILLKTRIVRETSGSPVRKRRRTTSRNSLSGDEGSRAADTETDTYSGLLMDSLPIHTLMDALLLVQELATVLVSHFSSSSFLSLFVNTPKTAGRRETLSSAVETLLQEVLQLLLLTADNLQKPKDSKTTHFWRHLSVVYQILDKIQSFLPVTQHLGVVLRLCSHSVTTVQRKALEMLHGRLTTLPAAAGNGPHAMTVLTPLLLQAVNMVEETVWEVRGEDESASLVRQTALLSGQELARLLGAEHGETFVRLMERVGVRIFNPDKVVINFPDTEGLPVDEEACGYALLSQLLQIQPSLFAAQFGHLLSHLLAQLKILRSYFSSANKLIRGACLALLAVAVCGGQIERHKLSELIMGVIELEATWCPADKTNVNKLKLARKSIADKAKPKDLLQCIGEAIKKIAKKGNWNLMGPLMALWERHTNRMSSEDFMELAENRLLLIFKFCINALSVRQRFPEWQFLMQPLAVEEASLFAVLAIFVKLGPGARRQDLMEMAFDWARSSKSSVARQIAFFRLCDCVASHLPTDLVVACEHLELFEFAASVLIMVRNEKVEPNGKTAADQELLLRSLLSTLSAFFAHGEGLAVSSAIQTLIPAVVGVLEVMVGDVERYRERCRVFLLPCLAALVEASGADETLLQPLCHQICLRMKSEEVDVKCQSLRVMMEVVDKLGAIFEGSLLPDCLPYLAECLEDDQPEVQDLSYEVCEKIKKVCGGDLEF